MKDNRSYLRSSDIFACISLVSMTISKNERQVDGSSTLYDYTGTLICSQRESIAIRLL